jgi:hypothetical protein
MLRLKKIGHHPWDGYLGEEDGRSNEGYRDSIGQVPTS